MADNLNIRRIISSLGGRIDKDNPKHGMAKCPAHNDHDPSLSITQEGDQILVHCHAGCSQERVTEALQKRGLWSEQPKGNGKGHPKTLVKTYDYVDELGKLLFQVCRYDPKDFRQRRPDGNGGWIDNIKGITPVLYHLPELIDAISQDRPILLVEGEKDVNNLRSRGFDATCNPMGACTRAGKKWLPSFTECLANTHCTIIPDNDDVGIEHANTLIAALHGRAASLRIVKVPKGKDATEFFERGGTVEQLHELIDQAPEANLSDIKEPSPTSDIELPDITFIDLAKWDNQPIPEQQWTVLDRFPSRTVALLSGEGGTGKTRILEQLAIAHVLGIDWLRSNPTKGPVIYVNCEDEEEVIVRRLSAILTYYGEKFSAVASDLHIVSLAGKDAVMAAPDRRGLIQPTALFNRLAELAADIRPVNTFLDNAANIFAGAENDRAHVRQFITMLQGLSIKDAGGIVMSSHPSLTGISTGTGLSGSTGWHNFVRARAVLKACTTKDSTFEPDKDVRELEFKKNQYGPIAETIFIRWKNGLYIPEPRPGSIEQMGANKKIDDLFLAILARLNNQGQFVSHNTGKNYAPKRFSEQQDAKGHTSKVFEQSMQRLLDAGKIRIETSGPPSKRREKLCVIE